MINKKLESLETVERSITYTKVERKNDSFLDLLDRMKALNSKREFEPHHRSPLTKPMTDNWHDRQKNKFVSTDRLINTTCRKDDERNDLKKIMTKSKEDNCCIMQKKSEVEKDVCPIEIVLEKHDIERQKNNKDSLIETRRQRNEENSAIQTIRKKMDEKENKNQDLKDLKPTFMEKNERSHKTIVKDKLNIVDEDKAKGMIKKR